MTNINRMPSDSPTVSGERQQHLDMDRLHAMATLTGRDGDLRQHVPEQPYWCRTIGDDVFEAIRRGEPIHPMDVQRLTYVLNAAQAGEWVEIANRKPGPKRALSL